MSCMILTNMDSERITQLAGVFGCSTGSLWFTYLGLPLPTTRHRIADYAPLINKIERRLHFHLPRTCCYTRDGEFSTFLFAYLHHVHSQVS